MKTFARIGLLAAVFLLATFAAFITSDVTNLLIYRVVTGLLTMNLCSLYLGLHYFGEENKYYKAVSEGSDDSHKKFYKPLCKLLMAYITSNIALRLENKMYTALLIVIVLFMIQEGVAEIYHIIRNKYSKGDTDEKT